MLRSDYQQTTVASTLFTSKSKRERFLARYMAGYCDALAIALSAYARLQIRALRAVHMRPNGVQLLDQSTFLHAYAIDGAGNAWDAKGWRRESEIFAEFGRYLDIVRLPDDESVDIESETFADAREFVLRSGCSPDHAGQALLDAATLLGLDDDRVKSTVRALRSYGFLSQFPINGEPMTDHSTIGANPL